MKLSVRKKTRATNPLFPPSKRGIKRGLRLVEPLIQWRWQSLLQFVGQLFRPVALPVAVGRRIVTALKKTAGFLRAHDDGDGALISAPPPPPPPPRPPPHPP